MFVGHGFFEEALGDPTQKGSDYDPAVDDYPVELPPMASTRGRRAAGRPRKT